VDPEAVPAHRGSLDLAVAQKIVAMQLDLDAERHHADDCRGAAGAQHAEGLLGGILRAERLEGIMHAALGQFAHRLDRVEVAGVDRVGGAELAREVELRGDAVDRDDALRSEEHTSELQSPYDLVCRLLLEKKKKTTHTKKRNIIKKKKSHTRNTKY